MSDKKVHIEKRFVNEFYCPLQDSRYKLSISFEVYVALISDEGDMRGLCELCVERADDDLIPYQNRQRKEET